MSLERDGARPPWPRPRSPPPLGRRGRDLRREGTSCRGLAPLDEMRLFLRRDHLERNTTTLRHQEAFSALRIEQPALLGTCEAKEIREARHRLGRLLHE